MQAIRLALTEEQPRSSFVFCKGTAMAIKLLGKKKLSILGLNSGTSADGIDLALIRFELRGRSLRVSYVAGTEVPYPKRIRSELERFISDPEKSVEMLARLDIAYGRMLGDAARKFIRAGHHTVDLIASHGQTVAHFPRKARVLGSAASGTVQIGDGNALAAAAVLPVVTDLRRADVSLGGEGAPLTPFVNHLLFGHPKRTRIIVNIGGIANFSYHPAGGTFADVRGGDCGPGNILSDMASRILFAEKYDRDGALAAQGEINKELVDIVRRANRRSSVSTGREQFGTEVLARLVHASRRLRLDKHAVLAAIGEATAQLISGRIKKYFNDRTLDGVYLTGGGRRNRFFVERLCRHLAPASVWPIEALDWDGDCLEAASFAVLGGCCVFGIASTLPDVTGAKPGGIAGKISFPPKNQPKK
jgi:anhydro-N-acetylmuramic acid kinase